MTTPMTLEDAVRHVTTTNPLYEVCEASIRGVAFQTFRNIPGTTRDLLETSASAQKDFGGTYLSFKGQTWTYGEFCKQVNQLSAVLHADFNVRKGQPVGIAMRNAPELLIAFLAITSIGGVAVFLNAWWTTEELDYALSDSGASLIFADADRMKRLAPLVEPHGLRLVSNDDGAGAQPSFQELLRSGRHVKTGAEAIETDDDLAIMYSSGTTGHPKGVVLTHRGAMNAVYTWLMQTELAPLLDPPAPDAPEPLRPCFLVATPLFHVTATHPVFLLSLPAGARLVVMDKWDAEEAVRLIDTEQVTRFIGVPTQSADLMAAAARLGSSLDTLTFLGAGGAKRPAAQVGELAAHFPQAQVATGWGMTETNANGIGLAGEEYVASPGVAGRLYPPIQELRFLGDDGEDVPPGEVGEITVKSPCNMRLYLNKPDATAEVLQDGWLRTGDLGRIDADGLVTIVDRKKNIVIRGGENISCLDVEGALHRHPAVAEACAFAVPHERLGEVVGAGVYLRPGHHADPDDLRKFLAEHIAHFKIPEHFWFHDTPLPRGATDKLDRRGLRDHCLKTDKKELTPS